jgi:hypothetical protein
MAGYHGLKIADQIRPIENQRLIEIRASIDDGMKIINKTVSSPLFFLRYSPPKPSRASHTPHSHSMVLSHNNALFYLRNFFRVWSRPANQSVRKFRS